MAISTIISIVRVLVAAALISLSIGAQAQEYPSKVIRMVVPFAPGGGDFIVRLIGPKLTERWGQPVIVDNKPGASTIIGTEFAAKAAPDGYTFLVTTDQSIVMNPFLFAKLPYDPSKDFDPVAMLLSSDQLLASPSSAPHTSLKEVIAAAKAKPGTLSYGTSGGSGSSGSINFEMMKRTLGLDIIAVPYASGGQVVTALLSGQISIGFTGPGLLAQHIKAGKVRALGVLTGSGKRSAALPDVPTFAEAGLTEFTDYLIPWFAVFAPAGTSKDIVRKMNAAILSALETPEIKEAYRTTGWSHPNYTPEQFAAFIKTDMVKRQKLVQLSGAKAE